MQTYIVHWQFPDQESHMQGAEAFAGFVEGGCEGDEFDGFKVLNRVVNPEGANGWAIVESSNHQNIWKWSSCLLYTSPSPRDRNVSRMPSSA